MREGVSLRITARFPPGEGGGWERVAEALSASGFRTWDRGAEREGCVVEYLGSSMEGDEVLMRVKVDKGEMLDEIAEALLPPCWYLDIYYGFRGEDALTLSRKLGIVSGKAVKKVEGVDLILEYFPGPGRRVVSYRVGWDRRWGDRLSKIHRFLLSGERGKSIWGWIR